MTFPPWSDRREQERAVESAITRAGFEVVPHRLGLVDWPMTLREWSIVMGAACAGIWSAPTLYFATLGNSLVAVAFRGYLYPMLMMGGGFIGLMVAAWWVGPSRRERLRRWDVIAALASENESAAVQDFLARRSR